VPSQFDLGFSFEKARLSAAPARFIELALGGAALSALRYPGLNRSGLHGLLKNSDLSALPWKSGPLGPRKPLKINRGFSPRRRFSATN
jgi:hypothetical protein